MGIGFIWFSQIERLGNLGLLGGLGFLDEKLVHFYIAFMIITLGSGLGGWLAMISMVQQLVCSQAFAGNRDGHVRRPHRRVLGPITGLGSGEPRLSGCDSGYRDCPAGVSRPGGEGSTKPARGHGTDAGRRSRFKGRRPVSGWREPRRRTRIHRRSGPENERILDTYHSPPLLDYLHRHSFDSPRAEADRHGFLANGGRA